MLAAVFVAVMSAIHFGSVVDPTEHLRGLSVMVVDQDTGAACSPRRSSKISPKVGRQLSAHASASANPIVADRLADPIAFTTAPYRLLGAARLGVTAYYDRRGFERLSPKIMALVHQTVGVARTTPA